MAYRTHVLENFAKFSQTNQVRVGITSAGARCAVGAGPFCGQGWRMGRAHPKRALIGPPDHGESTTPQAPVETVTTGEGREKNTERCRTEQVG